MSVNDVTGDKLTTGASTDSYRKGWDNILLGNKTIEDVQKILDSPSTMLPAGLTLDGAR